MATFDSGLDATTVSRLRRSPKQALRSPDMQGVSHDPNESKPHMVGLHRDPKIHLLATAIELIQPSTAWLAILFLRAPYYIYMSYRRFSPYIKLVCGHTWAFGCQRFHCRPIRRLPRSDNPAITLRGNCASRDIKFFPVQGLRLHTPSTIQPGPHTRHFQY